MTNLKKKYKRTSGDRFLTYALMGFAIAFFVILVSLVLYNTFNKTLDYNDFDMLSSQGAVVTRPEDQYLVYYYTETCTYCQEIKTQVLEFADSNNANVKVYFWDASEIGGTTISAIQGTPAMLTIVNGVIVDIINGYVSIPATFDEINAGTYAYIK
ncbi:MAG: thioredoxin family protein [Bacilli bacterium]|nr:thioredoxin family protein [Bacilli bacterium]